LVGGSKSATPLDDAVIVNADPSSSSPLEYGDMAGAEGLFFCNQFNSGGPLSLAAQSGGDCAQRPGGTPESLQLALMRGKAESQIADRSHRPMEGRTPTTKSAVARGYGNLSRKRVLLKRPTWKADLLWVASTASCHVQATAFPNSLRRQPSPRVSR